MPDEPCSGGVFVGRRTILNEFERVQKITAKKYKRPY